MNDLNGTFWSIILGSWTFGEIDTLAEKALDLWLSFAESDDRLIEYRVNWERSDWEPRFVEEAATMLGT